MKHTVMMETRTNVKEDENSETLTLTFMNMFKRLTEHTGMHVLPHVGRASYPLRRLLWTALLVVGTGMIILAVSQAFARFYSRPVETHMTQVTAHSLPFPAITFCNENPVRLSALRATHPEFLDNITSQWTENTTHQWESELQMKETHMFTGQKRMVRFLSSLPIEERYLLGHNISTMLLSCEHRGESCDYRHFDRINNIYHGNCYTYQGLSKNFATSVGPNIGIKFTLFLEEHEYVEGISDAIGIRVVIHNHSNLAFPEEEGFFVSPGFITYIGLARREFHRVSEPYGMCSLNDRFGSSTLTYRTMGCRKRCLVNRMLEKCKCALAAFPATKFTFNSSNPVFNPPYCKTPAQVDCLNKVQQSYVDGKLQCNVVCPPKCLDIDHTVELSYAKWPPRCAKESLWKSLAHNVHDYENVVKNVTGYDGTLRAQTLKMVIFFTSMETTISNTVVAYTPQDMLSNIGGQMGLWLGLSICTLFEFLELFADIFQVFLKHICKKGQTKTEDTCKESVNPPSLQKL